MSLSQQTDCSGFVSFAELSGRLQQCLDRNVPTGVLFFELDDLARFNDLFGYETDKRIMEAFVRIVCELFEDMSFARIGTYGFIAIRPDTESCEDMADVASMLINAIREPQTIGEHLFYLTVSVGVAVSSRRDETAHTCLKRAEKAMHKARQEGINKIVFADKETNTLTYAQEMRLMRDLPEAIETGDIYFVYQAQYDYDTSTFVGAEMLARWRHPEYGEISPSVFIPLAEKSGMITPMMIRTLIAASEMFEAMDKIGVASFSLSINMPFQVMMEESFLETVAFLVDAYRLNKRTITFEIMEDTIPDNLDSFVNRLHDIKERGFSLAVDDYGTGHTSLTYLLHFPVDYLKVDRFFIKDIDRNRRNYLLFRSIVDMAKAMDLKVVVEGVERKEEEAVLRPFGDLTAQGFLYAKPCDASSLLQLVEKTNNSSKSRL